MKGLPQRDHYPVADAAGYHPGVEKGNCYDDLRLKEAIPQRSHQKMKKSVFCHPNGETSQ